MMRKGRADRRNLHQVPNRGSLFNPRHLLLRTKTIEQMILELLFTDDCALQSHSEDALQTIVDDFAKAASSSSSSGLRILLTMTSLLMVPPLVTAYSIANEQALRTDLLTNYLTGVRPEGTVTVQVSFQMTSIVNVDLKSQVLSVSGWWFLSWTDTRLVWDSASYGGIGLSTFYPNQLWKPALVVSNSMDDLSAIDEDTIPMRVFNSGKIFWSPPGILQVSCEMDPTYFPFDEQSCTIQVTSFGFTLSEVTLVTNMGVMLYYYEENGEWQITSSRADSDSYSDNSLSYGRLNFNLTLKRRPGFYWMNVLFPVIVCGMLAMFLFLLPAESGEKMGYSLTVLLTYVVLMTLLSSGMPTSAKHTPILEVYISLILGISGVAILLAILNLNIYHTEDNHPVPSWVRTMALRLSMTCLWNHHSSVCNTRDTATLKDERTTTMYTSRIIKVHPEDQIKCPVQRDASFINGNHRDKGADTPTAKVELGACPEVTWKDIAAIMDKVCFRLYFVLTLFLTAVFIPLLVFGSP